MIISNLIGIIADDLTGANDTALQFHLRGANTQIVLDYEAFLQNIKNTQVWAIATETRNLPVDVAYEKVKEVTKACIEKLNLEFFYKKVDSTIRGNIAAETLAMLDVLEWDAAIIVPAFPAEGRTTVGGYHLLKGIPVERTEVARDVHSPIFESHIPTLLKSQLPVEKKDLVGLIELSTIMKGAGPILIKLNELIKQGKKLIVADAVSITDIEQIVLSINKSDYNILPAGSAACAQVLGNVWLPELKNQHITKTIPELPKLIIS
ncbi:MAG TPA: four-carbon acid sugar kinase family protein, partial [Candidatus Gastranaerophilaceae bacterium]|nr:four-carbon acid sugar kinase family protein [Candidatus Gastranaerophilaceae bacterium]